MYELPKDKAFLVAVKAIITNSKGEILLLKVNTGLRDSEKWDLPGGLMEFEDSVESRVSQEVFEETGLKITDWKLIGVAETVFEKFVLNGETKDAKVIVVGFTTALDESNVAIVVSEEHDSYSWISTSELEKLILSKPTKAILSKIFPIS